MQHDLNSSRLSGSGVIPFPAQRRRTETDPSLGRYMLGVYEYVACGLVVTGLAAYTVTYSGFHAAMMEKTPGFFLPFFWMLLAAPLALVLLLRLSIDEMGFLAAQVTTWACSALTGFTFECISLVYTETSLVPLFFIAAGTFAAIAAYAHLTGADLSGPNHFPGMAVVGIVLAAIVNLAWGWSPSEFGQSIGGVVALVGLTAWDTGHVEQIYLESERSEPVAKKALTGALALYLDANPVAHLLRIESLLESKRDR